MSLPSIVIHELETKSGLLLSAPSDADISILCNSICEVTGVLLSLNTMKRLLGRISDGDRHPRVTTLTHIGHDAFSSCPKLSTLILPSGLQHIGHGAFVADSALHHLTIPDGITMLPTDCFVSSGLRSIKLPSQLRVLERGVFYQCRSLRSITLPASIERIGDFCFHDCDSLLEVTIHNPVPPNISNVFASQTDIYHTLYVPKGSVEAYRNAEYWQEFDEIKAIE